jgi:hypothetical protein
VKYRRILFFVAVVALAACILYGYMCYYEYQYNKDEYHIIEQMVPEKYRLRNTADDEWLLFDPSGLTESDFYTCYRKACYFDSLQQKDSSLYYYKKVLSHHHSRNEEEYEKIFSCGNDYWDYKHDKWRKYSVAAERTGNKKFSSVLNMEMETFENY